MSFMAHIHSLDPRTRVSITSGCGCDCVPAVLPDSRWSICDYHEGYEAALEQHAPQVTHR